LSHVVNFLSRALDLFIVYVLALTFHKQTVKLEDQITYFNEQVQAINIRENRRAIKAR
jgi:hypothetical protein